MSAFKQNIPDVGQINVAAFDFFKKMSQSWMDMMNKSLSGFSEAKENSALWPDMDLLKQFLPLQNGVFSVNVQKEAFHKMLSASLQQQKLYADLTKSGFSCATKTMEALRAAVQNQNDPAETMKVCRQLADEYCRSCEEFVKNEYNLISQDLTTHASGEEKKDKATAVKSKAQPEAKS